MGIFQFPESSKFVNMVLNLFIFIEVCSPVVGTKALDLWE